MNLFFLTILTIVNAQEKFCINCRHAQTNFFSGATFSKCKLFPLKVDNGVEYLVSGKPHSGYYYCSTARKSDQMCGPDGKYYDKKCNLLDLLINKQLINKQSNL
jgi:hypothetical protein